MEAPLHILDVCVGTEKPTIHHVLQIVWTKAFWTSFIPEVMSIDCKQICAPASVVDTSGQLLFLTNDVFNPRELDEMTRHASFLEANGKSTKHGVHKGGSKMVMFGIRYKYGKFAWYKHTKSDCYKQSEQLVELINTSLKCKFSSILHHMYVI